MLKFRCGFLGTTWLNATLGTLLACGGSSSIPQGMPATDPTGMGEPLTLQDLRSVGLALTSPMPSSGSASSGPRSNLKLVDAAGTTREAVASGSANVANFLIAPSNKVYLAFAGKVDLMTSRSSSSGCLLAEVAPSGGTPSCIDSELQSIDWNSNPTAASNPPVQFDSQGAIYYRGQGQNGSVLRKYLNGVKTDLINDNITINDFIVGLDGSVLITGITFSSNSRWIRRITPSGGLQNLVTTTNAIFMSRYPDGDIYMGIWSGIYQGVYPFSTKTNTLPATTAPYIGRGLSGYTPTYDVAGFPELQGTNGAFVRKSLVTTNGKSYAAVDNQGQYPFYQYYPSLSATTTMIKSVSTALVLSTKIVIAGLNASSANKLVIYDTNTNTEQELLPTNDIEIYHLNVDAAGNRVMFDGLNFADNKYVIGALDLATKALTLSPLGTGTPAKLTDFGTFY